LFEPNNLSLTQPAYETVQDAPVVSQLASVLADYDVPRLTPSIGLFAGTNVISRNYRVEWPKQKIFLKSRNGASEQTRLRHEIRMGRCLHDRGIPVPVALRTLGGDDLVVRGESCWVAYEFEEGDYFRGLDGDLATAGELFGQLTRASDETVCDDPPEQPVFLSALKDLLMPSALDRFEDEGVRRLIKQQGSYAAGVLEHLRSRRATVEAVTAVTHTDFHPLNLLSRPGGGLCILDLEDVKPYPLLAAQGFGSYKLVRQMWTRPETRQANPQPSALVEQWSSGWNRVMSLRFTVEDLGLGARYRVLSLVHFILDNASKGQSQFSYDLEKQFNSLAEIDILYGVPSL